MLAFHASQTDLKTSVTRRQAFAAHLRSTKLAAKEYRDQVIAYVHRLETLEEKLKLDAIKAIEQLPGVELRGATGKKLYMGKTTKASFPFEVKESKTFTQLVEFETLEMLAIEPKYFEMIVIYKLKVPEILKDLRAGVKLAWASLEENPYVGGLFPSPKEQADGSERDSGSAEAGAIAAPGEARSVD